MAITTTGYQTPATSREGLKPSVYDKIILIGADETPILSMIGTSEVKGIEHSWLTDTLAAQAYDEQIRKNLTREFEINAKNGVNINKDEAYRQHPMTRPDEPSIEQGGLKRLDRVSKEKSENAGIIQTFARPGSKLENRGLGYQDETIISQKGNLVNEAETNGLRDSVSSVGDNASRAGGRQAGDEQILRQGGRDTTNASQAKRPAQSDGQVEQPGAAKADGEVNAAAATKQVVEKQGSGANIGGLTANSNAHLGSGMVAGTLNSVDEDGNFSPERFAAGFLAGLVGSKAAAVGLRKMTPKLYNQILGAAEKMPQMANGNPRLLGKLYSNGKDVSLNSFAGEKAITANVGKLDQAKEMYARTIKYADAESGGVLQRSAGDEIPARKDGLGSSADLEAQVEIWQKTGWFKDKDGAWKFEIGDSNAKLNPGFQSGGRLGELLDHEELFKAYPELKDVRVVKIGDEIPSGVALSVKDAAQREKRGIYNVTYNDKTATLVRQDLQKIDDALILEKGSNKKGGAVHIKKHLDPGAQGAITQGEFLSVGKNIREYLQKYKKPFIDESGGRIYEWVDGNGVKFRVVVYEKADGISASHPNSIISFYSNRNLKKPMEFRNPQVKYDVNLNEWHKDSSAITKNADGSPKVFYHGSLAKDITEFKSEFDNSGIGFWFADKDYAANHGEGNLYETFLRIKNPLDLREENAKYPFELMREMQRKGLSLEPYGKTSKEAKEFLKQNGYDGIVLDGDYKERPFVIAFDSAQIKHVKNDGNFSDSPNIYKSGKEGYYSPAKNEIGLRDIGDKSTLMHEVQHAIQEIEDFARGGNMAEARSYLLGKEGRKYEQELKGIDKTLSNLSLEAQNMRMRYGEIPQSEREYECAKELFRGIDNREKAYMELSVLRDDLSKKLFEIDKKIRLQDIRETYRKIHGEAEARNVESRLNLDGETHPHETFDVNPNETIVSKEDGISYSRKIEEIKREHPNVEKELDESIAAMNKESFNDVNFKTQLLNKFDSKEITTQELGKSVNLSDKQLAVLKNDIKNADFKVINESKMYFDKIGRDGDKKRFFVDIAEDGSLRVDGYSKKDIDNIPVKQSALEELADVGDAARLKNMSFEVKATYRNELDPIKKEAILKTAEYNALKKEMRGIYNVINNSKESTNVYKDLQKIDDAIKLERGSKKKGGAVHIQKHLDPSAKGAVTQQEVMSIGESVREYIKKYKEPFVDNDGGKIYEWQDKDGVRFRVAVYDKIKKSVGAGSTTRITTTDAYESIITFYSDRNLNGRMDFLDPDLEQKLNLKSLRLEI